MRKFICEQVYSNEEKREQLLEFIASLEFLIANPDLEKYYPDVAKNYEECLTQARSLVASGFMQEDLSILSCAFRPVLWTFRDWSPPLIQMDDGSWNPIGTRCLKRYMHALQKPLYNSDTSENHTIQTDLC